tara:strand:- start:66 stop:815 length:750 start_codon:yes stop_codon:yes gene_type:complete
MEGGKQINTGENITSKFSNIADSGFIKHVTRFDSDTKSELSNIIQYLVIVIVPFYLLNKGIANIMPEFDEKKGNIELLGEVIIHSITLLLGIYIIHRIVTYLPTFSGDNLAEINFMNIAFLIIFIGLNSDNGKKVNIVYERLFGDNIEGDGNKKDKKDGSVVKVSQPLSGNPQTIQPPMPTHQPSRADYVGQHDQMQPTNGTVQQMHQSPELQAGGQQSSMGNAFGAGMAGMADGITAANEGFGAFSSF